MARVVMMIAISEVAEGQPRAYLPDRADEDWSFLKDAPREDRWDRLKYIPLGDDDWFMTLSGEVRYRPEGLRVRRTARRPPITDNYLLQRYLFGADVHLGTRARIFGEVQSGIINGSLRSPRPTDRNSLDLHQAFVELRLPLGEDRRLGIKLGRQELSVGSTRLISASPGLNVKRSFDGAGVIVRGRRWTLAGAAAWLVRLENGMFDDRLSDGDPFWGAAVSHRGPRVRPRELGAYYLGIQRTHSQYVQAIGSERRHTAGVKWTNAGDRFEINYDAVFQWGAFNGAPIRAWAVATETGYRLASGGWRPRLSVRADVASGDRDAADPRLQSFNPLFPGNSYAGSVGLLGPTNISDLTPALRMAPSNRLIIGIEMPAYWRTSTHDGVYATDLRLLVHADAGDGTFVGANPGVLVVWQATRHCQLQGVVTRFLAGGFLAPTFVSSGFGFYSATAVYRF
jgi:hypothetical protein